MKLAAATAIASLVETVEAEHILPSVFDKRIATVVAEAVASEAKEKQPSY